MATRSSILAWEIPWTEEPGRLQCMESRKSQAQRLNKNRIVFGATKRRNIRAKRDLRAVQWVLNLKKTVVLNNILGYILLYLGLNFFFCKMG